MPGLALVLLWSCLTLASPAGVDSSASAPGSALAAPDSSDPASAVETAAAPDSSARIPEAAPVAGGGPIDYLWVLRSTLVDPAAIDSVVARARAMGVRGLLVQVVGRGDAFYRSDLLPRAEALSGKPKSYDPLAEVLARATPAGLEVHAWVNCMLVWSSPHRPRDPRHVLNQHPEWVSGLEDGRRLSQLRDQDFKRLAIEGVFLSPAHPRVREWLASIAREIATRYPVAGIHLDYIRQPKAAVGFDPTTRARFAMETGVDPARFDRVPAADRARVSARWADFQRRQVTDVVTCIRDTLRRTRPVVLSAAVIADTITAQRANAQYWQDWVRDSVLDRVYLMCYAPSVQTVMNQLVATSRQLGATDRVVPGIAVFNTTAITAAHKIQGARALGFPLIALYSYDSLFSGAAGWAPLRDKITPQTSNLDGRSP